jgi:hypothetical protein
MLLTREQILAISIPKNSYELSGNDVNWIYGNLDLPARDFIMGLLKRKFENTTTRFRTDEKLALACHEIISKAKYEFDRHPLDRHLWIRFRQGHRARPEKVFLSYRQLWRGYFEHEVKRAELTISKDKNTFQNALDKALRRNSVLLRRANKAGRRARVEAFKKNDDKLRQIEKRISHAFALAPEVLARRKLIHLTHYRRGHTLGIITPDDYLHILFLIQRHNPDLIEFPLRFMGYLPCTIYDALGRKWLTRCSRDEMMFALVSTEGNSIPDVCNRLFAGDKILAEQLGCRRAGAFQELAASYEAGHYIAATLLATTQIEGVLWDFARYLNRRNIRIFKKGPSQGIRWPYPWNLEKNAYTKVNPKTKRPMYNKKERLTGAGGLLGKTRIGSLVSPQLISYLLDDFIQDRNPLAHGKLEDREYKPDAIAAIHCLMACLYEIAVYTGKIKA